jgi:hypothetical protein
VTPHVSTVQPSQTGRTLLHFQPCHDRPLPTPSEAPQEARTAGRDRRASHLHGQTWQPLVEDPEADQRVAAFMARMIRQAPEA